MAPAGARSESKGPQTLRLLSISILANYQTASLRDDSKNLYLCVCVTRGGDITSYG